VLAQGKHRSDRVVAAPGQLEFHCRSMARGALKGPEPNPARTR
jgi:hypothetical protein